MCRYYCMWLILDQYDIDLRYQSDDNNDSRYDIGFCNSICNRISLESWLTAVGPNALFYVLICSNIGGMYEAAKYLSAALYERFTWQILEQFLICHLS